MQQLQLIIIDTGSLQHRHTLLQTAAFIFPVTAAPDFCMVLLLFLSPLNNKERKQGNKIARESLLCYSFSRFVRLLRFLLFHFQ
jgi:hypothetical protein